MKEDSEKIAKYLGFPDYKTAAEIMTKEHGAKTANDMLIPSNADSYPVPVEDVKEQAVNRIAKLRGNE